MKLRIPRRILMTADPIGGVWTFALELTRAFEPYGVEVVLATMGARLTPAQHQEVAGRKNLRVFESNYRLEWMDDAWDDVDRASDWLLTLAKRVQPDLIHLNGYSHALLPWRVPAVVTAHSCVLSWWRAVKKEEAPAQYNEYRGRVRAGLAAAQAIAAPTQAMRESLAQNYAYSGKCLVIHNGRDARLFAPAEKAGCIFACGRIWDEAKNLRLMDEVARWCEWPIEIAGNCCHPIKGSVTFSYARCLGNLPPREISQRFGRAAIFVSPAFYEPFGLAVLEAALSGCVLVLADIPSLRELWRGAAVFVAPDDASALAETLNGLIQNERLRGELSNLSRQRGFEFSPCRLAERYLAAYENCLAGELVEVAA